MICNSTQQDDVCTGPLRLDARGHVDGRSKVVEKVIGADRNAGPTVNSDPYRERRNVWSPPISLRQLALNRQRGRQGLFGVDKHRHHRVTNRLDHGSVMGRDVSRQ